MHSDSSKAPKYANFIKKNQQIRLVDSLPGGIIHFSSGQQLLPVTGSYLQNEAN